MKDDERFAYVAGVIEGLAYARYRADNKETDGMKCIFNWFYQSGGKNALLVYDAFKEYPDYPPGAVVAVLLRRQCGG